MTHEEELEFLKACGAKLSELTADKFLGTAMVMFFPSKRIHCISNLQPDCVKKAEASCEHKVEKHVEGMYVQCQACGRQRYVVML